MKRETLQTILGLFIIIIIVTATFLYGNAQRQSQQQKDHNLTAQQTASPAASAVVGSSSNSSSGPNTAPVTSPSPNAIQGSQAGGNGTQGPIDGATTAPKAASTPAPAVTPIPDTGSSAAGLVGLAALLASTLVWMRSRRAILAAARVR